jgi:hypothetical protein
MKKGSRNIDLVIECVFWSSDLVSSTAMSLILTELFITENQKHVKKFECLFGVLL